MGLQLYDWYCRDKTVPGHAVHRVGTAGVPPVNEQSYRWLCSYYDAQVAFPERFVLAMLRDARALAVERELEFRLFTYHRAELDGRSLRIFPNERTRSGGQAGSDPSLVVEPAAVVNATGAWVDRTLSVLKVPDERLIGGTKGSHLLTANSSLRRALGDDGIYVEAADGRPIFLLPFENMVLVGTTDLPYDEDPASAVASPPEIDYLIAAVNQVFPEAQLSTDEVELHYCGVRPLPYVSSTTPASITRRHFFREHATADIPLISIIGGKLTTCRSLAEETVDRLLQLLGADRCGDTRQRILPGAENYPAHDADTQRKQQDLAESLGYAVAQIREVWRLCGTETAGLLGSASNDKDSSRERRSVADTDLPIRFVRQVLRSEWVTHLCDLVERRLMLLYKERLSREALYHLADLMVEEGLLGSDEIQREVAACVDRLQMHFGKRLVTLD
jgi:glycerol-3-phosphate dehydrogenase